MTDQPGLFDQEKSNKKAQRNLHQEIKPITLISSFIDTQVIMIGDQGIFRFLNNYEQHSNYLNLVLSQYQYKDNEVIRNKIKELSIPNSRLTGINNLLKASDLISAEDTITLFGDLVLQNDPYLLNTGFLWFLHYYISSNANVLLWSRLFNQLLEPGKEVSPKSFIRQFMDVIGGMKEKTFIWNGSKEIGAILRTYSEGLFKSLRIMIHSEDVHIFIQDDFYIPDLILLACILIYRDRYFPGVASLESEKIIFGDYSPGRILRKNETQIRRALDQLHNKGLITVETRLGLDQIRFKNNLSWLDAINLYFKDGE